MQRFKEFSAAKKMVENKRESWQEWREENNLNWIAGVFVYFPGHWRRISWFLSFILVVRSNLAETQPFSQLSDVFWRNTAKITGKWPTISLIIEQFLRFFAGNKRFLSNKANRIKINGNDLLKRRENLIFFNRTKINGKDLLKRRENFKKNA